ncbi:MAG TPA: OmpH family outer membrane protein [Saprospiraceae bacterium]|nr:OmpH family outer membrane protein [Saprospiraceae bacterium]HRK81091.1 OmpH family outer membrane protein [Saprospiraceae bacterium]
MMKHLLKTGLALLLMFGLTQTMSAQKFGYINSSMILAELPEVKGAEATLEALQQQLQKKGQSMLEKLQADYAVVQQKVERGELSPKQQETEGARLKAAEEEIGKFEQNMMAQLENKRNELLKPIYDKVNQAIKDVAKENGFQFIFDQGVLLFAEESQNVAPLVKSKLGI